MSHIIHMGNIAKLSSSTLLQLAVIWLLTIIVSVEAGGSHHGLSWVAAAAGGCRSTTAECMLAAAEDEYGTSSRRRALATTSDQYISYGALQRNTVPCSRRGASYYNCKEGAEANPYTRDCSAITRCRS